jgi:hypothetical protein
MSTDVVVEVTIANPEERQDSASEESSHGADSSSFEDPDANKKKVVKSASSSFSEPSSEKEVETPAAVEKKASSSDEVEPEAEAEDLSKSQFVVLEKEELPPTQPAEEPEKRSQDEQGSQSPKRQKLGSVEEIVPESQN